MEGNLTRGRHRLKWDILQGFMGKGRPSGAEFSQSERLLVWIQQRGFHYRAKAQETSRMMCLQGRCIHWSLRNILAPYFACQKFIGGLTVAPHGDGFFLKESRIQKINLWSRPDAWYFSLLSSLISVVTNIINQQKHSQTNYLPILQS